jgi:hypothetical protein
MEQMIMLVLDGTQELYYRPCVFREVEKHTSTVKMNLVTCSRVKKTPSSPQREGHRNHNYRYATRKDVSVKDGPHIRRQYLKFIRL